MQATSPRPLPPSRQDTALSGAIDLAGRTLLVLLFLASGVDKFLHVDATMALMDGHGVPSGMLPLVIALDLLASLAILLGWKTRIAAFLLSGFTLLAGVIFHGDVSEQINLIMLMKNISIAGGLLLLTGRGAGRYSMDARLQRSGP